jgi:hypothetical protein
MFVLANAKIAKRVTVKIVAAKAAIVKVATAKSNSTQVETN